MARESIYTKDAVFFVFFVFVFLLCGFSFRFVIYDWSGDKKTIGKFISECSVPFFLLLLLRVKIYC